MSCCARNSHAPQVARRACAVLGTALAVALTAAMPLIAQYQINPALNTNVNGALYPGGPTNSVRYAAARESTSRAMASEIRYAHVTSGKLPSDIRMGYAARGPLDPKGPISYVNYSPSYLPSQKSGSPPPSPASFSSMGSIRYASVPAPTPTMVTPQAMNTQIAPPMVTGGAIRYNR